MINNNSKIHNVDGPNIFNPEFVGKFMIRLHIKFDWRISNNSLAQLSL